MGNKSPRKCFHARKKLKVPLDPITSFYPSRAQVEGHIEILNGPCLQSRRGRPLGWDSPNKQVHSRSGTESWLPSPSALQTLGTWPARVPLKVPET